MHLFMWLTGAAMYLCEYYRLSSAKWLGFKNGLNRLFKNNSLPVGLLPSPYPWRL